MHTVEAVKKIKAPCQDVWRLIWEIKSWACFWDPLHAVEVLYDDGFHQDFTMSVTWQNRESRVRTVRFRGGDGEIHFFSPEPPLPTAVHHGVWKLTANQDGTTTLAAMRSFDLPPFEEENFKNYSERLKIFSEGFQRRLGKLVEKLGSACEK